MTRFAKYTVVLLAFLMLVSCQNSGDGVMETSSSSEREAQTEVKTETTVTEAETTTAVTTEETTTVVTATAPPVTTTVTTAATTTTPPTAAPTSGTTSNGHTVTVVDGVTYVDGVLIANKSYALPDYYNPGGLTAETYTAFVEMQSAALEEGLYLFVKSGFRSFADQRYIYNGYVSRDGQELADRYSARAGHSEHQSGMAIDVNSVKQSFANTPEGIWLRENCHLYGFIIRYPEGKESLTGYMYEPWHVRYVGRDIAAAVNESGLCLEEYFGITSAYGY